MKGDKWNLVKSYLTEHKNEMVIYGVMFGLSLAISLMLASGDIGEAIAGRRR